MIQNVYGACRNTWTEYSRRYQQIILIDLSWRLSEKRSLELTGNFQTSWSSCFFYKFYNNTHLYMFQKRENLEMDVRGAVPPKSLTNSSKSVQRLGLLIRICFVYDFPLIWRSPVTVQSCIGHRHIPMCFSLDSTYPTHLLIE